MTPAEQRAADEGLTVVQVLTFDAMRIAAGNPMICHAADGSEVLVRLYTADEFLARQHQVAAEFGADYITRADAEKFTKPMEWQS